MKASIWSDSVIRTNGSEWDNILTTARHLEDLCASSISHTQFRNKIWIMAVCINMLIRIEKWNQTFSNNEGWVFQLDYVKTMFHKLNELRQQIQGLDRHQFMIRSYVTTRLTSGWVGEWKETLFLSNISVLFGPSFPTDIMTLKF